MDILQISHVSKAFGKNQVLKNLTFSVPEHSVFGFIGQNGAGKTTTMKMILGLLRADQGEILVNGEKVVYGRGDTCRHIGCLPDVPEFYSFMTPAEYLDLCGQVTGMGRQEIRKRSGELLCQVGLEGVNRRIGGFSRGMKQRLGIARALMNSPRLLICDEPTSALDPVGRKEILEILQSVREHTTVLFSTHILSDVERICDRIGFLHGGSVVLEGSLEEVRGTRKGSLEVEFLREGDEEKFLGLYPEAVPGEKGKILVPQAEEGQVQELMGLLWKNALPVRRMEFLEPTLEELFMEVVGK